MKRIPDAQFEELKSMISGLSEKMADMDGSIQGLAKSTYDEFQRVYQRFDKLESYTYEGFAKVNADIKYLHTEMSENFKEVRSDILFIKENYVTKEQVVTIYKSLVPAAVSSTS